MSIKRQFLKKVKVVNFKSFNETELIFNKFNVIIGSNASGKSNFVQIFNFLKHIKTHGLENAISLQGGMEHLTNIAIGRSKDLSFEITLGALSQYGRNSFHLRRRLTMGVITEITYKFSLKFGVRGGYKITEDKITFNVKIIGKKLTDETYQGIVILSSVNGKIKIEIDFPAELNIKESDILPTYMKRERIKPHELLLESPFPIYVMYPDWMSFTDNFAIYDFDPKLPKKAVPITGKSELESDGSNVSLILKDVIRTSDSKRKFLNLLKELLPFIDTINTQKFADKSLIFKIKEKYFPNHYLPSFLLSDGTISITSLILALFFEDSELTIIEEPERNIHPALLAKLIEMMKDASQQKQIIITTHNPEIVKYAGIENIITVLRDKEGFSQVERPSEKEKIIKFLENEMSISDLYVDNLLA